MVVLVRHAEFVLGTSDDPSLNDAGRKRAQDLAAALHDAGVSAILTSEFRRTRETAQPIAAALGLTPKAIGVGDGLRAHLAALARAVRGEQSGAVLVIGHGETVPMLIAELGGPRLRNLCETAFDRLFVLVPAGGKMLLTRARYGAIGPGPAGSAFTVMGKLLIDAVAPACRTYYIHLAGLRGASETNSRGLIDLSGSCPWPGPWAWSHGAHLLS